MVRFLGSMFILAILGGGCRSAFYIGEEGEHLVVVNKRIPTSPKGRTLYTVKNVTQEGRFMSGSRMFNIHSRHVFDVGDTVQFYRLESPKRRGLEDDNQTTDKTKSSSG